MLKPRHLWLLCSLLLPGYTSALADNLFVVANKAFGISKIDRIVLRSIMVGKSRLSPSGKRIMLALPKQEKALCDVAAAVDLNQWQITSNWDRQIYSDGARLVFTDAPADLLNYLKTNGGAIAVLDERVPEILSDKDVVEVKVEQ